MVVLTHLCTLVPAASNAQFVLVVIHITFVVMFDNPPRFAWTGMAVIAFVGWLPTCVAVAVAIANCVTVVIAAVNLTVSPVCMRPAM